jgi:hypothetical protein
MRQMWQTRPEHVPMIVAGYGSNPNDPAVFKIAHQYTDGQGYGGGLPEGVPPFGNCDMNSADGLSPSQLASALGVGDALPVTPPPLVVSTVPPDYQRLIYEQLAGPVGSDGYGHGWTQLGNLTIVDYLAKYKPALDVLLTHAPGPAKKSAPRIVIPATNNGASTKAGPAKKAPARKTTPRKR